MKLTDMMSTPVTTVALDDNLKLIKEVFDSTQFHHILVVGERRLMGVISDRDLLKHLSPTLGTMSETSKDLAILQRRAHQIMSRKPVSLNIHSKIVDGIAIFRKHKISCIPIVDDDFIPVGIITLRDIIKCVHKLL